MASGMTPLHRVIECIEKNQNFVLQGGAGSGKTETLSQVISAATLKSPSIRIACITHTNRAADEIASRVSGDHSISTIHSFINRLITDYKKNIHSVVSKLFEIDLMVRLHESSYSDVKTWNKEEHERYKKVYEKFSAALYTVHGNRLGKVEGKKIYDNDPKKYNDNLNVKIIKLNEEIRKAISEKSYKTIDYNETRFNNFRDLTYGHDGLLFIAAWLFKKFPLLGKVLSDKFDCIFVDEYQDTDEKIISLFLNLPKLGKTTIGFFGDSMQAIYGSGIGNVDEFVKNKQLIKIEKEDNYRCSQQVINFINSIRDDNLIQEVAFKTIDGKEETIAERQGSVELFYSVYDGKPHSRSSDIEKMAYVAALDALVERASYGGDSKTLLLTNNAVSSKANFAQLYKIFSEYYLEPKEKIEQVLTRLQLLDLSEICLAFREKKYNFILSKLKKSGLSINNTSDKKNIADAITSIIESKEGAITTVKRAFDLKLLKKSEGFTEYLNRVESTLMSFASDEKFREFEVDFENDGHTYLKMLKLRPEIDEEHFEEQRRNLLQRDFFENLLSDQFSFADVLSYLEYEDEQTPYITMHKTKGTGIDNVMVVLEEYFWNEYDFSTVFDVNEINTAKRSKNMKLVYVACSRAKKNLRCVRLVSTSERELFLHWFKDFRVIEIDLALEKAAI